MPGNRGRKSGNKRKKRATLAQKYVQESLHRHAVDSLSRNNAGSMPTNVATGVAANAVTGVATNAATGVATNAAMGVAKGVATCVATNAATGVGKSAATGVATNAATGVATNAAMGVAKSAATGVARNFAASLPRYGIVNLPTTFAEDLTIKNTYGLHTNKAESLLKNDRESYRNLHSNDVASLHINAAGSLHKSDQGSLHTQNVRSLRTNNEGSLHTRNNGSLIKIDGSMSENSEGSLHNNDSASLHNGAESLLKSNQRSLHTQIVTSISQNNEGSLHKDTAGSLHKSNQETLHTQNVESLNPNNEGSLHKNASGSLHTHKNESLNKNGHPYLTTNNKEKLCKDSGYGLLTIEALPKEDAESVRRENVAILKSLFIGDLIELPRGILSHWGVYLGNNNVAHLTHTDMEEKHMIHRSPVAIYNRTEVKIEDFWMVVGDGKAKKNNMCDRYSSPLPPKAIVKGAKDEQRKSVSSSMFSNSEQFAKWCRYGNTAIRYMGHIKVDHRITNAEVLKSICPGDLIEFPRDSVSHWGVYVGDENVVHLTGNDIETNHAPSFLSVSGTIKKCGIIKMENFWTIVGDSKAKQNNEYDKNHSPLKPSEIVSRSKSKLAEYDYTLSMLYNSEEFAKWCRYDIEKAEQDHTKTAFGRHNTEVLESLCAGDLIEFPRDLFSHWGVYIGNGNVVHLTTDDETSGVGQIKTENFWTVVQKSKARKNNDYDTSHRPLHYAEIVRRAKEKQGEAKYHKWTDNCEHFAKWCRYDIEKSSQTDLATTVIGGVAILGFTLLRAFFR